eukprot:scaffold7081_cov35-Phaeocystis_antarctica.AAC.1
MALRCPPDPGAGAALTPSGLVGSSVRTNVINAFSIARRRSAGDDSSGSCASARSIAEPDSSSNFCHSSLVSNQSGSL